MPSFETLADIFTRLSVFDSPKGSSNTFKTHKNISLYFKRRYLIIYNYLQRFLLRNECSPAFWHLLHRLVMPLHEFLSYNIPWGTRKNFGRGARVTFFGFEIRQIAIFLRCSK